MANSDSFENSSVGIARNINTLSNQDTINSEIQGDGTLLQVAPRPVEQTVSAVTTGIAPTPGNEAASQFLAQNFPDIAVTYKAETDGEMGEFEANLDPENLNLFVTDTIGGATFDGAFGVEIIRVGDTHFVYSAASADDRIVISQLQADGTITFAGTVERSAGDGLDAIASFASIAVNGTTYLYGVGEFSDAVSTYRVETDGSLTRLDIIFDSTSIDLELDGTFAEPTIANVGETPFLIVSGFQDDGLSVFQIGVDGLLSNVDNISDAADPALELNGASDTASIVFNGTTYVIAVGRADNGFSIFELDAMGQLTFISSVADGGSLELFGAEAVETLIIDGTPYIFVGGLSDDGISVFSLGTDGVATNLFNYSNDSSVALNGVTDLEVFSAFGTDYLAVTAQTDDGVTVYAIQTDGSLVTVNSVFDVDGTAYELDGARQLETVEIDGQTLLVITGQNDDGLTVVQLENPEQIVTGTETGEVLFGRDRDEQINALAGDDAVFGNEGNDTINAGQGDDLASGGGGNDRIFGDGDLTQTESDVVTVSETGQDLALTVTLPESGDGTSIEISGIVGRVPQQSSAYNIIYVIDISGSMADPFSGIETVGDINSDGLTNTLLDGTIAAFQSLTDGLLTAGVDTSDLALIQFDDTASTVFNGVVAGDVDSALLALRDAGGTNFESALQQSISTFATMGTGENVVFFISDGENNTGGAFTDETATLVDPNGLDATINAFGLGNGANLTQLDLLDDGIANNSVVRVLEPSTLTSGLTGSPVQESEVERLEIRVNGVLQQTIDETEFLSTPFGLQYNAVVDGLSTSAGDVIDVTLIASDTAETEVSVSLTVPNAPLAIGDDVLVGGTGDDTLFGNGGNDTLLGEDGADLLLGGTGDDLLEAGTGLDQINGGSGNDTLVGGLDADTLTGGVGDDVYRIDSDDLVDESTGATSDFDTIVTRIDTDLQNLGANFFGSFEGISLIGDIDASATGDDMANQLSGNDGMNGIFGLGGIDTLVASGGDDTLNGGADTDTADYTSGSANLSANLNSEIALAGALGTDSLISIENLLGGTGNDTVFGSTADNRLEGNDGDDLLAGVNGDDVLIGGAGADALSGGNDNDLLDGGTQNDRLFGNNGNDTIFGGNGDDLINGGNNDDVIDSGGDSDNAVVGGGGNDDIRGRSGNDGLNGSAGDDRLRGDSGNDRLFGGSGEDTLEGGTGNDTLDGVGDNDTLEGGDGEDGMNGGGGNDLLEGGADDDRLFGGSGADTLEGGSGDDLLVGQSGLDTYVFEAGWGQDQISGYGNVASGQARVDEVIDFSSLGITFADLTIEATANFGTLVYITADGSSNNAIEILFRPVSEITAGDFFFGP